MAKASLWQRIKGWFSGNKSAKSSGSSGSSYRSSNYYSSRKDGGTGYYRRAMLNSLRGKEEEEKPKYRSMAEATKKEPPKEKSSFAKLDSALKKDVPDPKRAAASKSQERAKESLNKTVGAVKKWNDSNKQQSKEFNERTNHKYDVKYWEEKGDKKKAQEARIRVKSGGNTSDVVAEELAVKYHPTAYSAARGAASGATFGASELAIKSQAKRDKERAKNEQYYQENKNKTAETVGELVGAFASFGATAGATEKLGAKVVSKAAPRAAERLAEKKVVQGLAKRGVNKAVKKGLVSEATEELIKQTGRKKAEKIVSALGNDIVQNLTTGAIYDINKASAQHEVGSKDWWKELGTSAALNFAVTGGVAGGAVLGGNKKAAVEAADELGRLGKAGFVKQAPDAKVSLNRKRRTDVVLPNERPLNVDDDIDDLLEDAFDSATTVEDYMALGLPRAEAEILARPIRVDNAAKEEVRFNPFDYEWDSTTKSVPLKNGNIKPLAENLNANELMPRSRNAEWRALPRSAERVDTSVEGIEKQLDELENRISNSNGEVSRDELRRLLNKQSPLKDRLERAKWRREGGSNMDAMRKAYEGEYSGFDMSKSTNSYQSDALEGKIKGKKATIVEMTPDEYMERAYRQIFKKPSENGARFSNFNSVNEDVVKYAEAMRNGDKFPLPYLDFTNAGQEGRHRALAAKMAGIDKIPVVVIDDATNPKALIDDAAEALAKNADSVLGKNAQMPTREMIESGQASYGGLPIKYDPNMSAEARNMGTEIRVSKKFFDADDATQKHILNHEVSHGWSDELMAEHSGDWQEFASKFVKEKEYPKNSDAYRSGKRTYQEGLYGDIGATSLSETTTRAITEYLDDPDALMRRSPEAYEAIKEFVERRIGKSVDEAVEATAKGTKPAAENLKPAANDWAGDYKAVEDDIPVDNLNQTRVNDTNAEAQARAKRVMEEPPKADESSAKGAAKQTSEAAEEAGEREFTQGQKEAREAFYKKTGTKLDEGKAATDDQILDALGNYERSQGTSAERKLSKVAFSQVAVSTDEAAEKLLKMQDEGAFGYDVVHHSDMYKEVANDLENDWDRWIDKICDVAEGGDWSGKESTKLLYMSQYLAEVTDAAKSPEQDALSTMAYKAIQKLSTTSAQTMNGRRAYAHLSKAGKMECALDDMVAILDPAIGFNKQHRKAMMGLNKYERQHYIKGQLLKDEKLKGCLKKLANAKTNDEISEAYTEMLYQFNKSNPKSGFDVVQELRYLNMLGNPKTHIRNMFGSGFFSPMRQVSNMIRGSIEDRIAKEAGLEITKHGGLSLSAAKEAWAKEPKTEAGKAALEAFESVKKDLLGSAKYDTPTYAGRGKTLVGKAIDKLSDFNSSLLSKEDDFFKSRAFKENYIKSYNKYLKDGVPITDKIKKQIEQEAFQEAQIATFNEYNEFAKWLSNITRKAGDANASTLARWGARGVNAVMPFTKVPANLMKQSINYSPIGIAKGMLNIKQAAKKGDAVLLNRAIDELSSGLTGTAVFGLGMLLGKTTDMFTTNTGKNDPAAKFKKDRGMQNYSITFKDPETGQGHSFTLDWLVPTSATFFSGVEMANQLKRGDFNILDIGNDWSTVMTRLAEPVMETSMLSGLHGMLETMRGGSDSDDAKSAIQVLLRETAQSYMSSMIPTVLGQASRTAYKSDMQITGEDDWEYFWNQTKSKAGLANTNILGEALGADTDAYGNIKGEKNSASDYVKSGLKNFLSPANIQKVDFSEVDNEKLRVYEDAVKNGADPNDMAYLFPKKQYKKQFSVAGEDVKMSNKDLSTYNQAKTKGGEEGMRYILENIMFNRYDYDSKGKKVPTAEAYTKAEKQALMEQFKGKSMREVEEWLYQQPEFKNASKAEQKKAISGLWGLSKDTKTVASQRVGEQAVYKAQGKDVNEYNYKNEITESKRDQLQPYIDSGLLTYEEAVDFARNGGKVSYTEDEDGGGSATTYYSKAAMIDYFVEHGIPYDKAEALYNAFKAKNAKPYSGNNKSSSRRGYGGYRRSGGGGRKAKVPKINAKSMASATKSAKGTTVKLEPPKPKDIKVTTKFKDYDI